MDTLQEVLASRGIIRPCELAEILECSRQMAQTYWRGRIWRRDPQTGERREVPVRMGREVATRLAARLDLPLKLLLLTPADPISEVKRGRRHGPLPRRHKNILERRGPRGGRRLVPAPNR